MKCCALVIALGSVVAISLGWQGVPQAATYQLQVASIPERVFMYFVDGRTLPRIESYLDSERSKFVLFRDRQPQALEFAGPGRSIKPPENVTVPGGSDPWGTVTWHGERGQLAVFRIRGIQSNYQKLRRVAVYTNGMLTHYRVRQTPTSQLRPMTVPATSTVYLTRLLERGAFPAWVERRAVSYHGLSVIVGRHHNAQESDTVYLFLRMPQAGRAYKVILGWKTLRREGVYANTQRKRN